MPNRTTAPTPRTLATRSANAPAAPGKGARSGRAQESRADDALLHPQERDPSTKTVAPTPDAGRRRRARSAS
jgi:hypothetical protein